MVRSLLDVLRFLHNDFQWRGTNKLCFTSLIVTHHFLFTLCMYFVYFWVVAINIIWFDLIWFETPFSAKYLATRGPKVRLGTWKMNRDQETHPMRVNARYEMNWANSFFKKFRKRTDRHWGESSIPPFHLKWSWGIIIHIKSQPLCQIWPPVPRVCSEPVG